MTGRDRRQTRGLITSRQMSQDARRQAAPKPTTNRVWDQPEPQRAPQTQPSPTVDIRPMTVEFTALRLMEALIRKDGRIALTAVDGCVQAAKRLLREAHE